MADNLASFKVFCQGGLNTSRDALSQGETQPGSAISLINYEPAVTGGYRRISGFSNDYGVVPGTGNVLGIAVANGINNGILAARKPNSGSNYLHYWDDNLSTWAPVNTSGSPTMNGVIKVRFRRYNWGSSKVVLTDGINPAATYDGSTYTQITHAQAPTSPKYSSIFQNHVFLSGDSSEPTNLYFSAPYDETSFGPEEGAGVINVGYPIVATKAFRDALYIFGLNNIKKLTGNNIANFVLENVTDDLGCLSTDSIIEIGGDVFFLSQDGYRPISGTNKIGDVNLESISRNVQSIFSEVILKEDLDLLSSVVVREKSQFRILSPAVDFTGLVAGIRSTPEGNSFEFGQLVGIGATCSDSGYLGQFEYVLHGDSEGKVHRQETGNSFDGFPIISVYQTPFIHMEDPEQRKVIHTVATYLRSEGDNELAMSVLYDYEDFSSLSPSNFTLGTVGAASYYSSALYNATAIYSGNPAPVVRTNVSGSGRSVSVKYVTNDTNASHSIQGLVVTFGVGDRL